MRDPHENAPTEVPQRTQKSPNLVELFHRQCAARPHHPALVFGDETYSYQELGDKADALADRLRALGARRGAHVGLFVERSSHAYVALLAILKSGAAYVPMDPEYPAGRVRDIAQDAALVLLVTDRALCAKACQAWDGPTLLVDEAPESEFLSGAFALAKDEAPREDDLCYIIYTSGSTGHPKGVMLEHRNVAHYILAASSVYGIRADDRIYQGFSLAFDASVEELWLAWANGGTLVGGDKAAVHCPESVARLLQKHQVTVFSSVPTFLSLVDAPLPTVRLLVVGGEVCPPELVARFAHTRCMMNTYGPTEAAVVATAAQCRPGELITIGKALPGYLTVVVDEQMNEVPQGCEGELLIGGPGVARGYLNRPEMTAERFVADARLGEGRFYRSGDRVRLNALGNLEFIGRADGQVKIRGFRVELAEIEAALLEQPGIQAAAVKVHSTDGVPFIAAFVVPREESVGIDRVDLSAALRRRLADYMVPRYLDSVAFLPMLPSGKIDRATLPAPKALLSARQSATKLPVTPLECRIAAKWEEVLGEKGIAADAHLFDDLGGHSLLAAQIASHLRKDGLFQGLSVKDLYDYPTVAALAGWAQKCVVKEDKSGPGPAGEKAHGVQPLSPSKFRHLCAVLQIVAVWLTMAVWTSPVVGALWAFSRYAKGEWSLTQYLTLLSGLFLCLPPALLLASILGKWLIIGRYKPGSYPLWGSMYLRWWIVERLKALSGVELLVGSPFILWYYRLMGARIGRGVHIHTSLSSCFDLISIGENSSIGAETSLLGYRVEDGRIIFGSINIGRNCFVGIHSSLSLDTVMQDGAKLDDLSSLADGEVILRHEAKRGSPAVAAEVYVPQRTKAPRRPWLITLAFAFAFYAFFATMTVVGLPVLFFGWWIYAKAGTAGLFLSVPLQAAISVLSFCLMTILMKWVVLGKTRPGVYRVDSLFFVRKWLVDRLMSISRTMLLPLYATLYTPIWMKCLGAKLGRRCEVSTVSSITPDMLEAGDACFFADGAVVGGLRVHLGWAEIGINKVGSRSFIGNSGVLPTGVSIAKESLLGCLSVLPAGSPASPEGAKWLGSPPFLLPNLQPTAEFSKELIDEPTTGLVAGRLLVDALRILVPTSINTLTLLVFGFFLYVLPGSFAVKCLLAPLGSMGLSIMAALTVILLKWVVMGRFKPVIRPLWSPYVWFNELINGAYEATFAPSLSPLLGTPWIVPFLRLIGIKIGRRVYVGSLLFSEFDLVAIGDDAALNLGATIQTHLFENRIIKSSYLKIGARCTVGNMSVVLYDTSMAESSRLGSLSLLMKGETLERSGLWTGIPCREVLGQQPRPKARRIHAPQKSLVRTGGTQIIRKKSPHVPHGIPAMAQPRLNFLQPGGSLDGHTPNLPYQ